MPPMIKRNIPKNFDKNLEDKRTAKAEPIEAPNRPANINKREWLRYRLFF